MLSTLGVYGVSAGILAVTVMVVHTLFSLVG